jgi:tripartite-type tricarboxylate transporter receptor subunit TctC
MKKLKKLISMAVFSVAVGLSTTSVFAAYPDKPIKIVVPYSTGGSSDLMARMIGDFLSKEIGQSIIVENRAGAGSMIGTAYVAESAPDGYTMLLADVHFTIVPSLYAGRIKYDAQKDFAPVALLGTSPMYLFIHPDFKGKNLEELAKLAKQSPGTITIGSGGNGSFTHMMAELFMRETKTKLVHVPYKGAAAAMQDLAGGQINVSFSTMPSAAALFQAGKVIPIATSSPTRHRDTPNVPTLKESGFEGMTIQSWWGLMVPSKTPLDIRNKLNTALSKVLKEPVIKERMSRLGVEVAEQTDSQTLQRFLEEDFTRWNRLVREANISLN